MSSQNSPICNLVEWMKRCERMDLLAPSSQQRRALFGNHSGATKDHSCIKGARKVATGII